MFRRVLVANRGEVASRIIRTCRRLRIESVAIASSVDRRQAFLEEADEVVCVGGPSPAASYLDGTALLETARRTRCGAVHPGWGFLAENSAFAARCEALGLTFIGPPAHLLHQVGHKIAAQRLAWEMGVQGVPCSVAAVEDAESARRDADALGYPVFLKAVLGGGGKGIRRIARPGELAAGLQAAAAEAAHAFTDGSLFVEKALLPARHVEVQVLWDRHGNHVLLGSRDCSLQRLHQKVVEEAPAMDLPAACDEMSHRLAGVLARRGFVGAGTLEFLVDEEGTPHFLECNPRLQVEHPLTEETWGIDLVEQQLRLAAGHPVPSVSGPVGFAVEGRLNAEDPRLDFRPSPGVVRQIRWPGDVRIDTHLRRPGDTVPPQYDALLGKVIATGATRAAAWERFSEALDGVRVEGVATNLALLRALARHPTLRAGPVDTLFLERHLPSLLDPPPPPPHAPARHGALLVGADEVGD